MFADLKPYPEYKDFGQPWLGAMPAHWHIERLDRLFRLRSERPVEGDQRITGYLDGRVTLRSNVAGQKIKGVVKEAGWQRVHPGDFAISGMNAHLGGMGVSDSLGKCSPIYLVLIPKAATNAAFVSRCVRHIAHSDALKVLVSTIRFNSADFKRDHLKLIWVQVPPPAEQAGIVRFLGAVDRKVNRFIRAKRRLIEVLTEQKQAIITHAVTKGLNPHAPLKPSGIDWLGDVPEHWRVLPLKRWVSTKITDGPHETPALQDDGIDFVSAEAMANGKIVFTRRRGFITRELHETYCQKCRPQRDDIFMCKSGNTTGKVALVDTDKEFSVWSPLALIRCKPHWAVAQLMFLVLASKYVQQQVQDRWSYGTQPNLSMAAMERIIVALPDSLDEQQALLRAIQSKTGVIDATVERALREIDLIREYRTRLVADVVTGKVDVRAAAAALPDEPLDATGGDQSGEFPEDALGNDDAADADPEAAPPEEVEA